MAGVRESGDSPGMKRTSSINRAKRQDLIEKARAMSPEERLQTCVNLSHTVVEFARAGKRHRKGAHRRRT